MVGRFRSVVKRCTELLMRLIGESDRWDGVSPARLGWAGRGMSQLADRN